MSNSRENIGGIFLDADFERMINIDLPLVTSTEVIVLKNEPLAEVKSTYGEFAFMGDFHYGNKSISDSVIHGYLEYLKRHKNIPIGLMGDILEYGQGTHYIREDDKVPVDEQITRFVADFKPLAHRIKFILWGNHEERFIRKSKMKNLMRWLALELGIDLKSGNCFIGEPQRGVFVIFKAGEKSYGAYVQHSKTSARINQDLQLRRAGSQNVVALIAHGHTHRLAFKPRTFRALERLNGNLMNFVRRQYLLATGCFLKHPSYAEAGSYPYTDVGSKIIKFYSDHNEIDEYDLTNRYKEYIGRGGIPSASLRDPEVLREAIQKALGKQVVEKCLS